MRKPHKCTIIGSSGRNCVLILLFQLYGYRAVFHGDLFCVGQYESPSLPTFILEEELIQYKYNFIQFLSNLSEIIPSQKSANIIL